MSGERGSAGGGFELVVIGVVESPLVEPRLAPKQGDEGEAGGVEAWIVVDPRFAAAAADLEEGGEAIVLTWLHLADRSTQRVHPRSDPARAERGVFSTRSPDRPNPIGLHSVRIVEIRDALRLRVRGLEAVDGTPVLDLKPLLAASPGER
jgi:tRNA-Thr(GGU) m(6)t(6)A37 methyltransferase TsaA